MKFKFTLAAMTACTALTMSANAAAMICPFTDHFFIKAPLPLTVLHASTDGNLEYTGMSADYFRLSCKDARSVSGGTVSLDIGMTDQIKCSLKISDGPYQMNPSVTEVTCGGPHSRIYFIGMDHPYGSHDYYLKFTM